MQTYANFRPTGFDAAGAFIDDRADWLVMPVAQNRDSGPFDLSNFAAALEALGGEGDDVEVHRFGHWGPGWFEIIIVRPGTTAAAEAERIEESLEDYPLLDEEDLSRREYDDYSESWSNWGAKDFRRHLRDEYELRDTTYYALEEVADDVLREFFEAHVSSGEYYTFDSGGCNINFTSFNASREQLAQFIREHCR